MKGMMARPASSTFAIFFILLLCTNLSITNGFIVCFQLPASTSKLQRHAFDGIVHHLPPLRDSKRSESYDGGDNSNNNNKARKGYKFGDITKSLIGSRVEKITGKPYQFGDLSRTIDSTIKEQINTLTGNDDYQFGDLSKYVDSKIKRQVNKFTNRDRYEFGDLTREIMRRVKNGEYTMEDLFLLFKALAIFEASISPVAGFLPVKLLVDLLNFSLANDIAGRVSSALAMELDRRLKKLILGDENYVLGDATRKVILGAVKTFTGKDSYSFGDVTKMVVSNVISEQSRSSTDESKSIERQAPLLGMKTSKGYLEPNVCEALEKWDKLLAESEESKNDRVKLEQYLSVVEKGDDGEKQGSRNSKEL